MANTAQAKKRAGQAEKHRQANQGKRTMMRTYIKRVLAAIESGDRDAATAAYNTCSPVIDRMANRGIIHPNKAARHKSRLNGHIHAMS